MAVRPKVVDASAVAALLFAEPKAEAIAESLGNAPLVAPTLLPYEVSSVCLKKLGRYPDQRAALLRGAFAPERAIHPAVWRSRIRGRGAGGIGVHHFVRCSVPLARTRSRLRSRDARPEAAAGVLASGSDAWATEETGAHLNRRPRARGRDEPGDDLQRLEPEVSRSIPPAVPERRIDRSPFLLRPVVA